MDNLKLGERISIYRRRKGLSKKKLAWMCGISPSAITRYENCTSIPRWETMKMLSIILDVSINRLTTGYDKKKIMG